MEHGDTPLTQTDLYNSKPKLSGTTTANLFRQQAGVEPVTYGNQPLLPDIEKNDDSYINLWLRAEDANKQGLPHLEVAAPFNLENIYDMVGLESKLRKIIDIFVNQKPESRKHLRELINAPSTNESSLARQIKLTQAKLQILVSIADLDPTLSHQLQQIKTFYDQALIPFLNLSTQDSVTLDQEIHVELQQPKENSDETYAQKAHRVLVEDGKILERYKKYTRVDALTLPATIQEQLLNLATSVNHIRLLEHLEAKGLDLVSLKKEIASILEKIPTNHLPTFNELNRGNWRELTKQIAKVTNLIAGEFPHDTVYLLGHVLAHHQAVCAGKAMLATMVLRDLGLDAVQTHVMIHCNSDSQGDHVDTHVRFPNQVRLTLDLNWDDHSRRPFNHLSSWLLPSGQILSDPNLVNATIHGAPKNHTLLLRTHRGFEIFKHQSQNHKLVSESQPNEPLFDAHNLAVVLELNPDLFAAQYGDVNGVLTEARRLYLLDVKKNPNRDHNYNYLGSLLAKNPDLFAAQYGDVSGVLTEARRLYFLAIKNNPNSDMSYADLAFLLKSNPMQFSEQYGGPNGVLVEAHRLYLQALEKNPDNNMALYNLGYFVATQIDNFSNLQVNLTKNQFIHEGIKSLIKHNRIVSKTDPNDPWISESNQMIAELKSQQSNWLKDVIRKLIPNRNPVTTPE